MKVCERFISFHCVCLCFVLLQGGEDTPESWIEKLRDKNKVDSTMLQKFRVVLSSKDAEWMQKFVDGDGLKHLVQCSDLDHVRFIFSLFSVFSFFTFLVFFLLSFSLSFSHLFLSLFFPVFHVPLCFSPTFVYLFHFSFFYSTFCFIFVSVYVSFVSTFVWAPSFCVTPRDGGEVL